MQIFLIATLSSGIGLAARFMGYRPFRALLPFLLMTGQDVFQARRA